ncbi:Flavin-containing monooxygenase FMO GS-OX-like 9 [Camellia lanceoleosa]|uniref:Flavin-containing monooxygenase FMO GS-OX-like 9 n=1 Tax=Camellia lanceoleosa TaxID=1840588 RepID=A0ACC0FCH8_9ERIC|nr:Flavin-containing monooxygenase FMO GS-OX-like 9 [Camellia lanceoleosa]
MFIWFGLGTVIVVAARELKREGHNVVVFEQNHDVGGQWLYNPNVENEDPLGRDNTLEVHSSVYASLRLFTPREVVGYTDFPFVVKEGGDRDTRRSKAKQSEKVVEEVFDAVVVATGHYSKPWLPTIEGMDAWRGKQMHSHVYRVPEPFSNEVVVVVGNFMSGQDISMELVDVAKEIDFLQEDGKVLFVDGSWVIADTIIYCTGYSYSFPFLDTKGIVEVHGNRVEHLYEHTFPPSLAPSLSFVGIPRRAVGLPFFESQGKWIAELLSGKRTLPSRDEMMHSIWSFITRGMLMAFQSTELMILETLSILMSMQITLDSHI